MRYSLIMTLAKRRAFVEDGVVILPKLVPQELCRAAEEAIEATETENVGDSEPVQALYHGSPLCAIPRHRSYSTSTWASRRRHPRTGMGMWTALRSIRGHTRTIPTEKLQS